MNILEDLKKRGIFNNITNEKKFMSLKKGEGVYIGFDPTAKSLHLGNYLQIATLLRFKKFGFKPIAVLGGATAMIGDPSGKSSERILLDNKQIEINKKHIKKELESFGLKVIDNYDFYKNMNVLTFMRDIGKLLNVNYMINKDVVASRLETGISFTEFSYQLIQGWDFKILYEKNNIKLQVGGSDQWGNITSGIEIIRKVLGDDNQAVGITTNLLTTASGKKFGKSEGNALWLNKQMTSPFELYQYLLNTPDQDVEQILKWATLLSLDKIESIMQKHKKEPFKRYSQKQLALEVTGQIHSSEEAKGAVKISEVLFSKGDVSDLTLNQALQLEGSVPTFEKIKGNILDALISIKAAKSKREAREFVQGHAIEVNGIKVDSEYFEIKPGFSGKAAIIKKGKKSFYLIKY